MHLPIRVRDHGRRRNCGIALIHRGGVQVHLSSDCTRRAGFTVAHCRGFLRPFESIVSEAYKRSRSQNRLPTPSQTEFRQIGRRRIPQDARREVRTMLRTSENSTWAQFVVEPADEKPPSVNGPDPVAGTQMEVK